NYFARLILPVFVPALVAAVIGNVIQFGFLFSLKPVTPDPSKLIPKFSQFFKQAVFSAAAVFNLAKSLLKVIIIAAIAYTNIRSSFGEIVDSMNAPFLQSAEKMALTAFFIVLESALVLLVMAFFDYLFQKRQHREALKMTREELKREHKEFEGDPLVRSRLRRMMRDMLTQDIGRAVPQATVVVTNPTHFAVAIEHSDDWKDVPTVTAKGQDNLAQTIKRIAKNSGVPLVENVQLARALYAAVNVGDEIPHQFYEAVAAVLRYVYSMNADTSRRLEKLGEEAHV
ncbi:MAG: EscU/YscU/HrcU family type III secretion system export apparatus switch protein, partial [Spirochaetales bacterium]|nr:EscU/YscU/HrcU family type III secretion system export apparatus switch protein [Spirochaetales bacterium]